MDASTRNWESEENADVVLRVHEAQIQQLYRQTWVGLGGAFITTLTVCAILWQVVPQSRLVLWGVIQVAIGFARALLAVTYQRKAPTGTEIYTWARIHVTGITLAALMWALPSYFLWPSGHTMHQVVWPICVVSLSATSVAMYCTWKPSYMVFLLLTTVPLAFRLVSEGGLVYIALGLLALIFILVLSQTGRTMHSATVQTLLVSIRNEMLSAFLAEEKAKQEALTRDLQTAHDQLRRLSLTDELTGLWNRRYLNATLPEDVAQVLRYYRRTHKGSENTLPRDTDLVFAMVDLDHFKSVNDTYGHGAGDQVLMQMRQVLAVACRDMDTVVRWGGEEFLVVARNMRRDNFTLLVERIRRAVAHHPFDIGGKAPLHMTCSVGAAVFPFLTQWPDALSWEKVVELADGCLLAAKKSGRNAWIGVLPGGAATLQDFMPDQTGRLSLLVQEGKVEIRTSLPPTAPLRWAEL